MTEPARLNRSRGLAAALLASAKEDAAPPGASRRALAGAALASGAAGAVGAATKTTGAAKMVSALHTAARLATWKWVAVGVAGVGSVVTVGVTVSTKMAARTTESVPVILAASPAAARPQKARLSSPRAASPRPPDAPLPSGVAVDAPPTSSAMERLEGPLPSSPASQPSSPVPSHPPSPARTSPVAAAPEAPAAGASSALSTGSPRTASHLGSEIVAIDDAKRLLAGGSADLALAKLDAYLDAYPHGILVAEATALRIEALARSGRRAEAQAAFARFRAANPGSPLLENLARAVDEAR